MRNKPKQLLISVALLSVSVGSGFWVGANWERNRDIFFNRVLLKAGSINQTIGGDIEPFRHKMIKDLISKHLSTGMSKDQIIALLGEPSENEEDSNENEISYWLNEEYGWGIDPVKVENLVIKFNPNGSVEKITHHVYRK